MRILVSSSTRTRGPPFPWRSSRGLWLQAVQQNRHRFVLRVLPHESAFECILEDCLSHAGASLQACLCIGGESIRNRQTTFNLGDNASLLGDGGQKDRNLVDGGHI